MIIKFYFLVISEAICSHGRSYFYFTQNILYAAHLKFTFYKSPWNCTLGQAERIMLHDRCVPGADPKCVEMGIHSVDYSARGTFFTVTSRSPPYCGKKIIFRLRLKFELQIKLLETLDPTDEDKVHIRTALREELGTN